MDRVGGSRRDMKATDGESPQKRHLGAEQRRALQFLASSPFGVSEALMFAHGFKRRMLASLIRAGLATAQRENIKAGSRAVGRVTTAEARRPALEGSRSTHRPRSPPTIAVCAAGHV